MSLEGWGSCVGDRWLVVGKTEMVFGRLGLLVSGKTDIVIARPKCLGRQTWSLEGLVGGWEDRNGLWKARVDVLGRQKWPLEG